MNLEDTKAKICLPILKNDTLLKTCYENYCQHWLKKFTSVYQQKSNNNHEIILQKRREKFYELPDQLIIDNNKNSLEKYKGLLCQMNSTWAFRLINSKYYPYFGQNIGLVNNTKAIVVLQAKVRENYYSA